MVAFSNAMPRSDEFDALEAAEAVAMPAGEGVAGRIAPAGEGRPAMRLADPDRRVFPRRELSLRVTGRRLGQTAEARREPTLNLCLDDVSVGGLSATSQTGLSVGERVAVFFPPESGSRGWDAYGRVLRVRHGKSGYAVAVEFDPMLAA